MKLCLMPHSSVPNLQDARDQFTVLEHIHQASEHRGLRLVPRPYLLIDSEAALLVEWISGDNMAEQLFGWRRPEDAMALIGNAAKWLRKFHDTLALPPGTLDVESKLSSLYELEGDGFRNNKTFQRCVANLSKCAHCAGSVSLNRCWLHGDFKAENLIINNSQVIGIDIQTRTKNVVIYDIAQFFNTIELNTLYPQNWRLAPIKKRLYAHFLDCYLGDTQLALDLPLLWIRAFMLLSGWHTSKKQMGRSLRGKLIQTSYRAATRTVANELAGYCRT